MKLARLGFKHGTDKHRHKFDGVNYMNVYHQYFLPLRERVFNVLELGVLDGGSLKVWRDYFPNAHVWGVDINPNVPRDHGERIHVIVGSQTDPLTLCQVQPNELDIIIDDGSHVVDHMIESLRLLWPRVASRGLYVIEDLENIYADISKGRNKWPGQLHNLPDTNYRNEAEKLNAVFNAKLKDLDQGQGDMLWLHRWHQQAILCKK
jgi:hypothetical protein